jgi:hypothetical protein
MTYYNVQTEDEYISVEGDEVQIIDTRGVAIMNGGEMVAFFAAGSFVFVIKHDDEADDGKVATFPKLGVVQ